MSHVISLNDFSCYISNRSFRSGGKSDGPKDLNDVLRVLWLLEKAFEGSLSVSGIGYCGMDQLEPIPEVFKLDSGDSLTVITLNARGVLVGRIDWSGFGVTDYAMIVILV